MPELKRNFAAAKMNKDLDERLTPSGQYKDALNIQVSTSDESNVGAAQTLLGNTKKSTMATFKSGVTGYYSSVLSDARSTCVGSIALPDQDKIYYLIAAGLNNTTKAELDIRKDYIIEYDTVSEILSYVFVDIYKVIEVTDTASSNSEAFLYVPLANNSSSTINKTGIRIGMSVYSTTSGWGSSNNVYTKEDNITVKDIIYNSGNSKYKIFLQKDGVDFSPASGIQSSDTIIFEAPSRVLNFDYDRKVTAINIIDDMLFWTDNVTEPKKINITRSKKGTGGEEYLIGGGVNGFASGSPTDTTFEGETEYFHTRLVMDKNNDGNLKVVTDAAGQKAVYIEEKHVTVIKKAPTQPLKLEMSRTKSPRIPQTGVPNPSHGLITSTKWYDSNDNIYEAGATRSLTFNNGVDFREGDILIFTRDLKNQPITSFVDHEVRAVVVWSPVVNPNVLATVIEIRILSISPTLTNANEQWHVRLEDADPLFEFKFVRFSYRYKFADGEYSTFAPFSETAFLPDIYEYQPKKGFNLGMRNQLRGLKLTHYFPKPGPRSEDVVEIDLLYKETNNPTVYTIKTVKRADEHPIWPDLTKTKTADHALRGEFEVKTDLVHALVPSNQLLRPWDNVPRKALAQEISANRLIYGNYVQNYNVTEDPKINVDFVTDRLQDISETLKDGTVVTGSNYSLPSVKSMRTYQVGVVFSDGYGRETPVLTNKTASVRVPKQACDTRNRIMAKLTQDTVIPSWAKYYSWYIKEPTVEYYTMAMDRWYRAADGNIWISFPSSDRNKLDIETFLILKKSHLGNVPVKDKAKYKVLAIENEAPDHIKTESKSLGVMLNTSDTSGPNKIGTSTGEGYPFIHTTFIKVDKATFDSVFGSDLIIKTPDALYLKFYGANTESQEYEVTKITDQDPWYKLKIKGRLEGDIDFATTNNNYSGRISDLQLELIERKVENKPEFDGRFFVKIYKDAILETHILSKGSDIQEYYVGPSFKIRYLNNNYDDQPLDYTSVQNSLFYGTERSAYDHPTQHSHHAAYTWGTAAGNGKSYGLHYHDVNDTNGSSVDGLNGSSKDTEDFWKLFAADESFFIDAASAYSLTSKSGGGGSLTGNHKKDRPGAVFTDGTPLTNTGTPYNNWGANDGNVAGATSSFPTGMSNQEDVANTKEEKGQVSRGIWFNGTDCFMDISWSGMGTGWPGSGAALNKTTVPHKIQDVNTGTFIDAANFINELVKPGTKFRFQRDPDPNMLYTVQEYSAYFFGGGHPHGNPVFDANKTTITTGVWGIRNFKTGTTNAQFHGHNLRQRWTIKVANDNGNGIGIDGSGYNPCTGTNNQVPTNSNKATVALHHDGSDYDTIQIMRPFTASADPNKDNFTDEPAIWETEPKESVDLDIYYQASGLIPLELNDNTMEEYIPAGTTFYTENSSGAKTQHKVTSITYPKITFHQVANTSSGLPGSTSIADGSTIQFTKNKKYSFDAVVNGGGSAVTSGTTLTLHGGADTTDPDFKIFRQAQILDWNNCWCFGNGVESDRIRDDFNAPQMDNGVKASSVLAEPIKEERREHGLIWSGIYNSTSGINETNQFIQAEKITKDLNPVYGSIQKLYNRATRLIMFCEDKVLRAVTNKDALYNADGKPQLVASNAVVGDVTPYAGDFGISTNPESFAATPGQLYFADAMRGQVLALEPNGIRSISNLGMKDYFADTLDKYIDTIQGTYDEKKHEYNVTIARKWHYTQIAPEYLTTVSYSEKANGWSSFKSFYPESGLSLNNQYYTFKNGEIYKHHDDTSITKHGSGSSTTLNMFDVDGLSAGMIVSGVGVVDGTKISSISGLALTIDTAVTAAFYAQDLTFTVPRNNFYGTQYESNITVVFNDKPDKVKSFNTINYEGTQAKVVAPSSSSTTDAAGNTVNSTAADHNEYYNLSNKQGWYVDSIITNKQTGSVIEFKDKECKWFGAVCGDSTVTTNVDESEFSVQGLGNATFSFDGGGSGTAPANPKVTIAFANNTSSSYEGIDGSGGAWDSSSVISTEQSHWTVTTSSNTETAGATVSSQTVNLTITPIVNGIHSGYNLTAGDLRIGGASESSSGSGVWNGGNVDSPITAVTLTDNGQPGDPNNTINAAITVGSFTCPNSSTTYYIDIDEDTSPTLLKRNTGIRLRWPYSAEQTVTVTNISDITETSVQAGSSTTPGIYKFSGTVTDGLGTMIAEVDFNSSSDHHYEEFPTVTFTNMQSLNGDYSNHYQYVVVPTYSTNYIDSFKVKIFYTPPAPSRMGKTNLYPDPTSMLELNHIANIDFKIRETTTVLSNTISHVSYDTETDYTKKPVLVTVHGAADSKYKIQFTKQANTGSDSVAGSGGYYNFATNAFQDGSYTSVEQTIPSVGYNEHVIRLPEVSADTRYDILLSSSSSSTIPSTMDGHGELMLTQKGIDTITFKPLTFTATNFSGKLSSSVNAITPTNIEIKRGKTTASGFGPGGVATISTMGKGGNSNTSSTEITLENENRNIKPGMFVAGVGSDGTASSYNLKVSKVRGKVITLDSATKISDSTDLQFIENTSNIHPFEFTIPPGRYINRLTIGTKEGVVTGETGMQPNLYQNWNLTDFSGHVAGFTDVVTKTNGAVSSSTTVTLDATRGITVGMEVSGTGISGTPTVATVASGTQITLSDSQTISNDVDLTFKGNPGVSVVDLQATVEDGNVKVQGLLEVREIERTAEAYLLIDDFINVT